MPAVLGYWGIRGLAQPVRLLLAYTEVEYEDTRYTEREKWFDQDKLNLGLEVPNLPYYIDDHVKLTQSLSIMRYIAHKHGLAGDTPDAVARADMFSQDLMDLRANLSRAAYSADFEKLKPAHLETLQTKLKQYEAVLQGSAWLLGDKLSYADFVAYEHLDVEFLLDAASFTDFPNVKNFLKRFESLPQIKKYMESESFIRWPLNGPIATWGGKPEQNPFK